MVNLKQKHIFKFAVLAIAAIGVLPFAFTNCSNFVDQFNVDLASLTQSELNIPLSHPASEKPQISTIKPVIINRLVVADIIRDVFTNSAGAVLPGLENEINKWVSSRPAQFGLGCDLGSSYSGRDCGSSTTAVNTPTRVDVTTVRESYVLKICGNATSLSDSMSYVTSKIGTTVSAEPTQDKINQLYLLFYRAEIPDVNQMAAFVQLDADLKANGESTEERWRGLTNYICELSDWQAL